MSVRFNPPPGWPVPSTGWSPPPDWRPDPTWPPPPPGWSLWMEEEPDPWGDYQPLPSATSPKLALIATGGLMVCIGSQMSILPTDSNWYNGDIADRVRAWITLTGALFIGCGLLIGLLARKRSGYLTLTLLALVGAILCSLVFGITLILALNHVRFGKPESAQVETGLDVIGPPSVELTAGPGLFLIFSGFVLVVYASIQTWRRRKRHIFRRKKRNVIHRTSRRNEESGSG